MRSLLVIRPSKDKNSRPLVVLGRPAYGVLTSKPSGTIDQAILPRELVRQAMLIAARDELGLSTRDEVIDDTAAEGEGVPPARAEVVSFIRDHFWHAAGPTRRQGSDQAPLRLRDPGLERRNRRPLEGDRRRRGAVPARSFPGS